MRNQSTAVATSREARTTTREDRGEQLFLDHADEIWRVEPHLYRVPSCFGDTVYLVTTKRGEEFCPCPDHEYRGPGCKHLIAARIYRSKSGECASCRGRHLRRELVEVEAGHMIFHEGDELCRECALRHGAR